MTDAMFTFGWYALAIGATTGRYPAAGELPLAGGSPRYALYPTKDGRLVACGALEQKFWDAFCNVIGLAAALRDDAADPVATRTAIAGLIVGRTAGEWQPRFARADCCVSIVASLEEALRDQHFAGRGLFDHRVEGAPGETLPALPLPLAPEFREAPRAKPAPRLPLQRQRD
jgi:crotonobetainyl-CoA:carnitine CoA-transferase CaiB-like acyl-CoA transferase